MNDTLAKVIAQVESGGFPYALRFESRTYGQGSPYFTTAGLEAAEQGNHCNAVTGRAICSTSYGLFQIMGFNLYGMLGWKQSVATFLFDSEQQLASFTLFCTKNSINPGSFDFTDEAALEHFARVYNGPGDVPNYVAKMKAAYAALPA